MSDSNVADKSIRDIFKFNTLGDNVKDHSPTAICSQYNLIEDELVKETKDAIDDFSMNPSNETMGELVDGVLDVVVTAIGMMHRLGLTEDQAQILTNVVNEANLSKFDLTEEDAIKSVEAYKGDRRYTDVHYSHRSDGYYVIKGKVAGNKDGKWKILKSHTFTDPKQAIIDHLTEWQVL